MEPWTQYGKVEYKVEANPLGVKVLYRGECDQIFVHGGVLLWGQHHIPVWDTLAKIIGQSMDADVRWVKEQIKDEEEEDYLSDFWWPDDEAW